ncbi:MAG: M50 family metallopeptidase [Candidatus Woesearchaeota archaeon]|nr:M50 family metallopeptidase [Candidatus Woesearchaeota archaeon]
MIFDFTRLDILRMFNISIPFNSPILEIIDIIIMSIVIGFIFKDIFRMPAVGSYDPLKHYGKFNFSNFKFAVAVVAPAIVLHELGHKFAAMLFGVSATFFAAYGWLLIGIFLKIVGFGFIFFIPGFVVPLQPLTSMQSGVIAFAGPFVNLVLWIGSWLVLKNKKVNKKYYSILYLTKQINMFLFILNMLPIPGIDGFSVYRSIFQIIF